MKIEVSEDYGDEDGFNIIAEQTLSRLSNNLITEGKFDVNQILNEAISKSQTKSKIVLEDFRIYIENI